VSNAAAGGNGGNRGPINVANNLLVGGDLDAGSSAPRTQDPSVLANEAEREDIFKDAKVPCGGCALPPGAERVAALRQEPGKPKKAEPDRKAPEPVKRSPAELMQEAATRIKKAEKKEAALEAKAKARAGKRVRPVLELSDVKGGQAGGEAAGRARLHANDSADVVCARA
jgi:hypothetical protein